MSIQDPKSPRISAGRSLDSRFDRLRVRHLRLLELVATQGSLSSAATQLGVSQPGATKMLHELESAFGCQLLDRSARGGRLSIAGTNALARLRVALGELAAARNALSSSPESPLIRLGMLPLLGVTAMPFVVGQMSERECAVRLIVRESTVENLLDLMVQGELDCVVGRLETRKSADSATNFDIRSLWVERTIVAAAGNHPLLKSKDVQLSDLQQAHWILPPPSAYTRRVFDQHFFDNGLIPPPPFIESISFHTNLRLVGEGVLLTIAPENAVRHYKTLSLPIRTLDTRMTLPESHMLFITPKGAGGSSALRLLESALIEWGERMAE